MKNTVVLALHLIQEGGCLQTIGGSRHTPSLWLATQCVIPLLYPPYIIIGDKTLTPDDAIKVVEELLDVQKIRFFGLKLQLSERIVNAIHTRYPDPHEQLYYIIHEFLKRVEPRPTWTFIVNVLRSDLINQPLLAQSIENKFCECKPHSKQCKMLAGFISNLILFLLHYIRSVQYCCGSGLASRY